MLKDCDMRVSFLVQPTLSDSPGFRLAFINLCVCRHLRQSLMASHLCWMVKCNLDPLIPLFVFKLIH